MGVYEERVFQTEQIVSTKALRPVWLGLTELVRK